MESEQKNSCTVISLSLGISAGILGYSFGKANPKFEPIALCVVLGSALGFAVGRYLGNCIDNHNNERKKSGRKKWSLSDHLPAAILLTTAGAVLGIQHKLECDITAAANAEKLQTKRYRQAAEQRVEESRQLALQRENDYQTNILVPSVRQLTRHFKASADILNQELRSDQAVITERQNRMDQDGKTLLSELPLEARGELLERLTVWDNNFSEEFREVPRPVTSLDFLSSAKASNWLNTNGKYDFSSLSANGPTRLDFSDANTVNEQVITVLPEIIRRVGNKLPKSDAANLNQAVDAWRKADKAYGNFQERQTLPYKSRIQTLLTGLGG